MSSTNYRPEIDGLRAIAVLGVVLFHAGLGFPGGYVGVDVFFVISGFLITGIILKNLEKGSFSLIDFWVRRIRRILPAVSVMVLSVLIIGVVVLNATELTDLSKSSIAQSAMLSNVYFWRNTGYFVAGADFKPLLHTWTLAVEEQFYVFFPILLVLISRLFKKHLVLILFLIFGASLAFSVVHTQTDPKASFFLLPTRAWELLAGSLLAATQGQFKLNRLVSEVVSFAGIIMICIAMFAYDGSTAFPGYSALLPVLGAVAVIGGCKDHQTGAGRILSTRPMVFIGLISYSLYLWHWPIFSYMKINFFEFSQLQGVGLILISIVCATLSWKFVENPFRTGKRLVTHASAIRFGVLAFSMIMIPSVLIWRLDGLPGRISEETLVFVDDMYWHGAEFQSRDGHSIPIGAWRIDGVETGPDFVLWGDSHGMALSGVIGSSAAKNRFVGEAYLFSGRIPIPGLWRESWTEDKKQSVLDQNEQVLQSILDRRIPNLILICRWTVNIEGRSQIELDGGAVLNESLITDGRETASLEDLSPGNASDSLRRQLIDMLNRLETSGTRVWFLMQVPESNYLHTARQVYIAHRFPLYPMPEQFTIGLDECLDRQRGVKAALEGLESERFTVVDPTARFFDNEQSRLEVYGDRSYYRDDDHLTNFGAHHYLDEVFDQIFTQMQADE